MQTPWGESQSKTVLAPGIVMVSTAGHGGIMVHKDAMKFFHPAVKLASVYGGNCGDYICFEEDCEMVIVLYELQELGINLQGILGWARKITKEDALAPLSDSTYESFNKFYILPSVGWSC